MKETNNPHIEHITNPTIKKAVIEFLEQCEGFSTRIQKFHTNPQSVAITINANTKLGNKDHSLLYSVELYVSSLNPEHLHGNVDNGYIGTSFTYSPDATKSIKEFLEYIVKQELISLKNTIDRDLLALS